MPDPSQTLVVLTPAFPDDGPPTNWVTSQQLMVKSLKENYPHIQIIVLSFYHPYHDTAYHWNQVPVIPFNAMEYRKLKRLLLWQKIWRRLKKIRRENDLIGILSFWCGECALIGRYFGKRYHIKHRCWICGQDARESNKMVRLIKPPSEELIAMSASLANEFKKNHGIKVQRIIPNAIDRRQFPDSFPVDRDIDILGAGSLEPLKRYSIFVAVVESLKKQRAGINAMICGDGPEKMKLVSLIESCGLTGNISLPGLVPHPELLQIMQRAKIFLHTSEYEGFSTVCLEALYAGAQVISFHDPGEGNIPNWHIVHSMEEMIAKARELLSSDAIPRRVLVNDMEDSARAMMELFDVQGKEKAETIEQNISYYNEAANEYNNIMDLEQSNQFVRRKVKEKMLGLLKSGWVLDFGGGTGLDLEWLASGHYKILFCEPAVAMREKAIRFNDESLHKNDIVFLETGKTDFRNWHHELPFSQKVDAILSNFGVINYIPDLPLLFKNLAGIIKPGGHFIALVLDLSFKKKLKSHRRNAISSFVLRHPFVMYIPYKEERQTVIVHTLKEIKKASRDYFDYCSEESLSKFGFTLIQLVRNETACQEMVDG